MGSQRVGHDWATELNWATLVSLWIVCGWFHSTMAELTSCYRDHMATKNIFTLYQVIEKVCWYLVQSLSRAWIFAPPWTAARLVFLVLHCLQLKLISIDLVMPSNHLILCHPFSSCLQSFPASGSFPLSRLFTSCGQSIGDSASASNLPMNIQGWFPVGWTGLISLQSKGLSRVFSSTTVPKHHFFSAQPFLLSSSHIRNMTTGKTIALTIGIFVGKVMSLHFNTL